VIGVTVGKPETWQIWRSPMKKDERCDECRRRSCFFFLSMNCSRMQQLSGETPAIYGEPLTNDKPILRPVHVLLYASPIYYSCARITIASRSWAHFMSWSRPLALPSLLLLCVTCVSLMCACVHMAVQQRCVVGTVGAEKFL
jgi:hypothetical protein